MNLREWRKHTKLTQRDLAKLLGASRQTIYAYEKGHYSPGYSRRIQIKKLSKNAVLPSSFDKPAETDYN